MKSPGHLMHRCRTVGFMEHVEFDSAPFASCTLDSADRQARGAEFGRLFSAAIRAVDRPEPTRLLLELEPTRRIAAQAAELAMAETACCSFFTFNMQVAAQRLVLDIAVPPAHVQALDALATAASASRPA
jgi:hypothetical protein